MAEGNDTYPELLVRLQDHYDNIVENLQTDYFNYANNPVNQSQTNNEVDSGKFAKCLEQLISEDFDPTVFDCNKNVLELITQLRSDNEEITKLIALKMASIKKLTKQVDFYISNSKDLQDAMKEYETNAKIPKEVTNNKQVLKARQMFNDFKKDMNYIIESLFPEKKNEISSFLSSICVGHLENEGTDYVQMDDDSHQDVVELLIAAKIISAHPHQRRMYKLNL